MNRTAECTQPVQGAADGERGSNSERDLSDETKQEVEERIFITNVIAMNVSAGLQRVPAGFYVAVGIDGMTRRTSNKPTFVGNDIVEWDESFPLPLERSLVASFKVYASYELDPMLGKGELLREFGLTMGELIDHHEQLRPIRLKAPNDSEIEATCSSLQVVIERRVLDANKIRPSFTESDDSSELAQLTDAGHHAHQRYRRLQGQQDLDQAIAYFEQAHDACPPDHPSRAITLFNLATVKRLYSQVNRSEPDLDTPIALYRDALQLRPRGHPDYAATLLGLGLALLARSEKQHGQTDVRDAKDSLAGVLQISPMNSHVGRATWRALQEAELSRSTQEVEPASLQPDGDEPDGEQRLRTIRTALLDMAETDSRWPMWLAELGFSLADRFEHLGNLADIHECIFVEEDALRLTPDDHSDKLDRLNNLGISLLTRFKHLGDLGDLDKSIRMKEEALLLAPEGHPLRLACLNNLANSLEIRFQRFDDLDDLEKAISIQREALRLAPDEHPAKHACLSNLGNLLSDRFERLGELCDLDESISAQEDALDALELPHSHLDKPSHLNNLAMSLQSRFERLANLADLERAIRSLEESVQLTPDGHSSKPGRLNNLGNSLLNRFERLSNLGDLDRSISVKGEALQFTPDGHPEMPTWMDSLANSLHSRFEHFAGLGDLEECITVREGALELTPDAHPDKPGRLSNLGSSLLNRFDHLGNLSDLDRSISLIEEAARLLPDRHPHRPGRLNNLGITLLTRFDRLNNVNDLNKSILVMEEALKLTPDNDPQRSTLLQSLASALHSRFERLADIADLERAISILEESAEITPDDHPNKAGRLNSLGILLLGRFGRVTHDLDDLNKSISLKEAALQLTPDGHTTKPSRLNSLAVSLQRRFEHAADLVDLEKAILIQTKAVQLAPDAHPDKPVHLINFGRCFLLQFEHTHDPSNLTAALSHFSSAACASAGPPSTRFRASRSWISCAHAGDDPQTVLDAYTVSVNLLPELAWIGLPLQERHRLLHEAADIARDAAAAALEANRPNNAVEWLEQGRSIVWSQLLQLRTAADELHMEYPALADQFQQVSLALEQASTSDWAVADDSDTEALSLEGVAQKHRELALTRDKLLAEIRSLPRFERFLLPKTIQQLTASAPSGPVVYLNASKYRCDALIVVAGTMDAIHVPLPGITCADAEYLQQRLHLSLARKGRTVAHDDILDPSLHDVSEDLALQNLNNLSEDNGISNERGARVLRTPDDIFRSILSRLWEDVVSPILKALSISNPPPTGEKMRRLFWCPTGPFAFLPIHAAGRYTADGLSAHKLSDFVISSYTPTLSALAPSPKDSDSTAVPHVRLLAVRQPDSDGQTPLAFVGAEIEHIRALSAKSSFLTFRESHATVEDVLDQMKQTDWVHFACHGVQDPSDPLNSGLCLANSHRLSLSEIIRLSRSRGGLAFLSACQTAKGDETLSEEAVHLAAGMLLAGYSGVIATMWAIMDNDAPKVTKAVYEHLFRDGEVPDSTEAAEALHFAVQRLRDSGASLFSWVPFIHVGL